MWSGLSRSASSPAYSRGCSVLTRPPMISGKPVNSSIGADLEAGLVRARTRCRPWRRARRRARRARARTRRCRSCRRPTARRARSAPRRAASRRPPHRAGRYVMGVGALTSPPARGEDGRGPGARRRGRSARTASHSRSCSIGRSAARTSSGSVAAGSSTARWRMIRPVSTPSSTKWTVTPNTFTPYSSACSTARMPGKAGSSAGWTLTTRAGKRARNAGVEQLHVAREHDELDAARLQPVAIAASRAARSAYSPRANTARLDARQRGALQRLRVRLVGPDGDHLDALAPVDAVQDRLQVRAGAGGEDADLHATSSFGKRPPVERSVPAVSSASTRGQHVVGAQVRVRAVVGQAVVGVLRDDLRAPAAQHLDRARAPDLGLGGGDRLQDRLVEVADVALGDGALRELGLGAGLAGARPRGMTRREPGIAHVAARAAARATSGRRSGAGCPRAGTASPSTHAHTARYWRQRAFVPSCAAVRQRASARPSQSPASRPATRSGADGDGCTTPVRARWPTIERTFSSPRRRAREGGERHVVAAVVGRSARSPARRTSARRRRPSSAR